jgi:hypothetical protein
MVSFSLYRVDYKFIKNRYEMPVLWKNHPAIFSTKKARMQLVPLPPIRLRFFTFVFAAAMLLTGAGCQPNLPHANRVFVVQPFKGYATALGCESGV